MRIGIDFTSAARERAGIGRYARELVRALARSDHANRYVLFVPRDAHNALFQFGWPANFSIARAPLTERALAALWQRARVPLPVEAFIGQVDLFYSPDFLLPPTRARRTVVTVHDLSYVRVPECFPEPLLNYLNRAVPRALQRADLILADADSTQRDLAAVYHLPLEKIRVLYSGVDARFRRETVEDARSRIRTLTHAKPYVLSVGTIQPRKNYKRLLQAFAGVIANGEPPIANLQLVICGGRGWMYEEIYQAAERLGLSERVLFTDFVSEDDLPALYAMATLFVYPSLYEGFGLPIVEAMACGAPVISSDASSLPEVAGDAALYFDPYNVDAIAAAMRRVLNDEPLRAALRAKGFAQAKKFSWERAAQELRKYFT